MKVLVTGGAGFIGSHVVDHFIARGDQVVVVDNLSTGKREQVHAQATFYEADITSPHLVEIFQAERPEVVVHQAAQIQVTNSIEDPIFDATTNVIGTINLLEACRQTGVRKVVYASSAAIYGNPEYLPINEQHPIHPLSGYGVSKYTVEHYLDVYHYLHGITYTILRYGNVFGPRQDPRGEGGVISIFIDKIFTEQPITVFGDGEQTRDYTYVTDVARANLAAVDAGDGETVNIGAGVSTNLNEVIQLFNQIAGKEFPVEYGPDRPGDIKHSCFNAMRAEQALNWKAEISVLEGLRKTYEYYRAEYRKME